MEAGQFRFMLWQFIAAADAGDYDTLSYDEVYRHAEAETIPSFIKDRFAKYDLSVLSASDWVTLAEEWASFANAIDAKRKFGVYRKGVPLLMAYCLQSLQQRREDANYGC